MTFLADKAKLLKQNVQKHNDNLTERYKAPKQVPTTKLEDRTLLKKIVVYAKQPNFKEISKGIEAKINNMKPSSQIQTLLYP